MKHLLILLAMCLGGLVNAQTPASFASINSKPNYVEPEVYEYVQKIIQQKPIHVHPDSMLKGFTICWNGEPTTYTIVGTNNKQIKTGKIVNNVHIKTKRWKPGIYVLKVGEYSDILALMRK